MEPYDTRTLLHILLGTDHVMLLESIDNTMAQRTAPAGLIRA